MYKRNRKLRKNEVIRNLVKNVYLSKKDLIYPIFIEEGEHIKLEISSMPGIYRYSIDRLKEELDELVKLGINSILLFGIPKHKDEQARESYNENGVVQNAVKYIKENYENFLINFQQNSFKAVYPPRFYAIMKKQKKYLNIFQ